jgi:hypothetical protein
MLRMPADKDQDEAACRLAIVQRAEDRGDELLAVVLSAIFEQLPEYGHARSKGEVEDIRSGVRRSIQLCLRVLAEGRRIDAEERVALHLTGGQRARQGIPKAVVVRSVTIATRDGYNFFVTCADQAEEFGNFTGALRQIRTIIGQYEDDAVKALADGHDEALGQVLTTADRAEAILVDRLLEGRWHDDDELSEHARTIGLHPAREARVIVVTALDALDQKRLRRTVGVLRDGAPTALGPLRLGSRTHLPAVIQPRNERAWNTLLLRLAESAVEQGATAVHGEKVGSLLTVSPSYKAIEHGLPFVRAATGEPGAISALLVRFHRVTCVGKPADRLELLNDVIGPLLALHPKERDELLSLLDTLYETGDSQASLSRRLARHKNTVASRFARIFHLTGLDVRKPAERLVLDSMLRLRFVAEADLWSSDRTDWWADRPA